MPADPISSRAEGDRIIRSALARWIEHSLPFRWALAPWARRSMVDRMHGELFGAISEAIDHAWNLGRQEAVATAWRPIGAAVPVEHQRILVQTSDSPPVVGEAWWRRDFDGALRLLWANTGPDDYVSDPIEESNRPVTLFQPLPAAAGIIREVTHAV